MSDFVIDVQQPFHVNPVYVENGIASMNSPNLDRAHQLAAQDQQVNTGSVSLQDAWALLTNAEVVLAHISVANVLTLS